MNKVGLYAGYWRGTEIEGDVAAQIKRTAATGVDVFELHPNTVWTLSAAERADIGRMAADNGLALGFNSGLNASQDISANDEAIRAAGIEYCKRVIGMVAETGADRWSGVLYSAWLKRPARILDGGEKRRVIELSLASLREIVKVAEDEGVNYCLEIVNRFEQFLLNTAAEGVAYAEQLASPRLKLLLDTFHMNIEEPCMEDAIRLAAGHGLLGHFHVGEADRSVPGLRKGHIDWRSVFQTLKEVDYQGCIVMEPFVLMGNKSALNICVWRDLCSGNDLDRLEADARAGAQFIRAQLRG